MIQVPTLDEIIATPFRFGAKEFYFASVNQWRECFDPHPEIGLVGGWGSSKTMGGIMRATRLSCWYPGNKGMIGRFASTDLAATVQADALEFWREANLLDDFVAKGEYKVPTATLKCIDPLTNVILPNKYSEVLFLHLDNPSHIRSHKFGWGWIEEAHECTTEARDTLLARIRRPGFAHVFSLWETWNPNGHDRLYSYYFDPEMLRKLKEKKPRAYAKRLGIIATTYENRFLPPAYIENMEDSYSEKKRKVLLECSFDSFEGQIFEDWNPAVHIFRMNECFHHGISEAWNRLLALDVGGSDPWAWLWSAVDPWGNVIVYDEINKPGTLIQPFVELALPKIGKLKFQRKVIDYENKAVAGELADRGIWFDNAQKQNKNDSIFRLDGYIHRNPKNVFPPWHPWAGTLGPENLGSPRMFVAANCRALIKQIPQARWRKKQGSEIFENELDPSNGPDDSLHAMLYTIKELPRPTEIAVNIMDTIPQELDKQSKIMHFLTKVQREERQHQEWNIRMGNGRRTHRPSAYGIPLHLLKSVN